MCTFFTIQIGLRKVFMLLPILSMLTFSSCEELSDCIASASPELQSKLLANGTVGQEYSETITAEVKNDPDDNRYDYYFNVEGKLPDGLTYTVNHRKFSISGKPTKAGEYAFKIILRIDPPDSFDDDSGDDNRICFGDDTTQKSYTIKVQ